MSLSFLGSLFAALAFIHEYLACSSQKCHVYILMNKNAHFYFLQQRVVLLVLFIYFFLLVGYQV